MFQQVCEYIHNYFIEEEIDGKFSIADGMISLPLLNGQRFLIKGSVLNDGLYTYHDDRIMNDDDTEAVGLQDETFAGTICALAVPPAVIALSAEIGLSVDVALGPFAAFEKHRLDASTRQHLGGASAAGAGTDHDGICRLADHRWFSFPGMLRPVTVESPHRR